MSSACPLSFPSINQLFLSTLGKVPEQSEQKYYPSSLRKHYPPKKTVGCVVFVNKTKNLFYIARGTDPEYKNMRHSLVMQTYNRFSTAMELMLSNADDGEWSHSFWPQIASSIRPLMEKDWIEVKNGSVHKNNIHKVACVEKLRLMFPQLKDAPIRKKKKIWFVDHPQVGLKQYVVVDYDSTRKQIVAQYMHRLEYILDLWGYCDRTNPINEVGSSELITFIDKINELQYTDPAAYLNSFALEQPTHHHSKSNKSLDKLIINPINNQLKDAWFMRKDKSTVLPVKELLRA